ncbi:MAG TPA: cation:proton antiporter, partial [Bryobacteraceae bacterium]|nr:cation:proton antiporter [Bryobacteraceae bacterium]
THENLAALEVFSEVALGLILFSIGTVFEFARVRAIGRVVLRITLSESILAAALVTLGALLLTQDWRVALLLGAIAVETAAASTLMVIRECGAEGPLSESLIGIIGINNVLCLAAFYTVAAILDFQAHAGGMVLRMLYESAFPVVWQLVGSVALGYLIGLLISSWATKVQEHGEVLILLTGCVLLCVGISLLLDMSPLVASLAVGATTVNLSQHSRRLFQVLSRSDPPFYAIFFVIAGADLDVSLLTTMGWLGVIYVIGRATGKFAGSRLGARRTALPERVKGLLGFGLMSQAGLAVGLALTISRRFPDLAPVVVTVVLAAVAVNEMIGPLSARLAIARSGESRPKALQAEAVAL